MLMVGLGNPGKAYAHTRHNLGARALESIAQRYQFSPPHKRFQGLSREGHLGDVAVCALFPTTFMNESGRAVAQAVRALNPQQIIVFQDELDLPTGKCRIRQGGGTAGHNGIKSIKDHIGADFTRVRLGIGRPDRADTTAYVLEAFSKKDTTWLEPLLCALTEHAPLLAQGHLETFANRVHLALQDHGL